MDLGLLQLFTLLSPVLTVSGFSLNPRAIGPVLSGLPTPWEYAGCYVDNAHGRVFENALPGNNQQTVETCIAACINAGFTVAGIEYASECFCGNRMVNGATIGVESTCNMACLGNATESCGGPDRLSVYSAIGTDIPVAPVPVTQEDDLPGLWAYEACYQDTNAHILPRQILQFETNLTPEKCLSRCSDFGYEVAALEYGRECYCGDLTDLEANNGAPGSENQCNMPCAGDPIHICGGSLKMSLYKWQGQMNVWHTPTNTGHYEFFVPGVVIPLIATLGINNKVTFLEKFGTGFPNTTGAYELDLSLVDDFDNAYREMHIKTDVFCAGSIILPDKGGRQLNVGGWSADSLTGVRLYTPDGSPGNPSVNDWEEDFTVLALQRPRWYPTAALLANGSVLVVGGEIGSNGLPQPNLEILPRIPGGDTVLEMDWLLRTDPWNLYPFITVLPSGRVFIAYFNEALILDEVTFDTIATLPNIPGAVDTDRGGRTYPLEGAFTLFPQFAPYTDPLRVLICGGSSGPGAPVVLDNCVSIEPEAEEPTWTLERMPSKRVMSCMAALPDGTILILNGAHAGVAGFGLASDPNLNAVLYNPFAPVGQRMSILGSTIVPRMYHSEATLLPDGRVLVSGSDPQTPGLEEEFRIEVYVPPYLTAGNTQPSFTLADTDWEYGSTHTIENLEITGSIADVKVSLIYATSSTHGNTMGARTIFPAVSCSGTSCSITAPPNANISPPGWHQLFVLDGPTPSHSQWVRIGGDPAELGNWPDLPGFTRPGV